MQSSVFFDNTHEESKWVLQNNVLTDSIMMEDGTCDLQLVMDSKRPNARLKSSISLVGFCTVNRFFNLLVTRSITTFLLSS